MGVFVEAVLPIETALSLEDGIHSGGEPPNHGRNQADGIATFAKVPGSTDDMKVLDGAASSDTGSAMTEVCGVADDAMQMG